MWCELSLVFFEIEIWKEVAQIGFAHDCSFRAFRFLFYDRDFKRRRTEKEKNKN